MTNGFEGGCRCRAVRYRSSTPAEVAVFCHCRDCQYWSGGAGSVVLRANEVDVHIEGTPVEHEVVSEQGTRVGRSFCGRCGTPLFARGSALPGVLVITLASLDDPDAIAPMATIWTASAPGWARIADDLPCFPGNYPGT